MIQIIEMLESLTHVELTVNNHLKNCNPVDLSGLPKNMSINFADIQGARVYNGTDDWEQVFGGITRSLETFHNKKQGIPTRIFENMLHQSKAVAMKTYAIKLFKMPETAYLNTDCVTLYGGNNKEKFLAYIYQLAGLFCVALPKPVTAGLNRYIDPTIENFIALQKGYLRIIKKMNKVIIEREIATEKRKAEYRIEEGKKGRKTVEERLQKTINQIKERKDNLFAVSI